MRRRIDTLDIDKKADSASPEDSGVPETGLDTHILRVPSGTAVNVTVNDRANIPGGWHSGFNRVYEWGYFANLSPAAKAVYKILEWRADYNNQFVVNARPDGMGLGYAGIAKFAGVSVESVKRAMSELTVLDLVRVTRRHRYFKGGEAPNAPKQYQLTVPAVSFSDRLADLSDAERKQVFRQGKASAALATARSSVTPPSGHTQSPLGNTPDPTVQARMTPREGRGRAVDRVADALNSKIRDHQDSSKKADATDLESELRKRGVGEPLLSRLMTNTPADVIRRHLMDFDIRNQLPGQPKKSPGWLVKSITVPYELHEKTTQCFEREAKKARGEEVRQQQRAAEDAEAEQTARLEQWTEEQFQQLDEEELRAFQRKVIEQYGRLARGLDNADPRTHERLRRLIKGMLAHLYPGDQRIERGAASKK
jgi:hypothetical protein